MEARTSRAKHLVVISYDAFSQDNWEMAKQQPNLLKLLNNGAYSTNLKSVYPTLTYVVHSTMVTGVYPDKHGIIHNNPFQPFIKEKEQRWYWFRNDIKVPTIYDELRKHKLKSAGILWPVTGKACINYNIPEIRAIKKESQVLKSLINGSPLFSIRMDMKFGSLRKGIQQPCLDDFTSACAVDTIKKHKPNLLLIHMIDLDDAKHEYGTDSKEVEQVVIRMDKRLGDIMSAVEEAGIQDETVFLILGDHGQINVSYKVKLNTLLMDKGLVYEENGEMKWRAYVQSTGGSAYLHIKQDDEEAERLALAILDNALKEDIYGIESIYTRQELEKMHVASSVRFMLEAKVGYSFDDGMDAPAVIDLKEQGIKYATHGYLPNKPNYKCNFIVSGDCIKSKHQLGDIDMIDIAPTIGKILGVDFNSCDGRVLEEIFREE